VFICFRWPLLTLCRGLERVPAMLVPVVAFDGLVDARGVDALVDARGVDALADGADLEVEAALDIAAYCVRSDRTLSNSTE